MIDEDEIQKIKVKQIIIYCVLSILTLSCIPLGWYLTLINCQIGAIIFVYLALIGMFMSGQSLKYYEKRLRGVNQ